MVSRFLRWRQKPPSERMAFAYQRAQHQFVTWLGKLVRIWETQPVRTRKMQLISALVVLLLLSCLSVYHTATSLARSGLARPDLARPDHFPTPTNQKQHGQQPSVGPLRRK